MNDENVYYFSASTLGFYPLSLKESVYDPANAWPADAVKLDRETYLEFSGQSPEGKVLSSNSKGYPTWTDAPPLSEEDQVKFNTEQRDARIKEATQKIVVWQTKLLMGRKLTADETAALNAWMGYIDALGTVDITADKIDWPQQPA